METKEINEYLTPTPVLDSDSPAIQAKAGELTRGVEDPVEKAKRLFYFARDKIKYDMFVDILTFEEYKASKTIERGGGFCVQKSVLLCALARAAGVPCRLGFADIINHRAPDYVKEFMGTNLFSYHGYVEFYLNGTWIKATPAFDLDLCLRNDIVPVEFDGVNDAMLPERDKSGALHIEYVRYHGEYADLPYEQIVNTFLQLYGKSNMQEWMEMKE